MAPYVTPRACKYSLTLVTNRGDYQNTLMLLLEFIVVAIFYIIRILCVPYVLNISAL